MDDENRQDDWTPPADYPHMPGFSAPPPPPAELDKPEPPKPEPKPEPVHDVFADPPKKPVDIPEDYPRMPASIDYANLSEKDLKPEKPHKQPKLKKEKQPKVPKTARKPREYNLPAPEKPQKSLLFHTIRTVIIIVLMVPAAYFVAVFVLLFAQRDWLASRAVSAAESDIQSRVSFDCRSYQSINKDHQAVVEGTIWGILAGTPQRVNHFVRWIGFCDEALRFDQVATTALGEFIPGVERSVTVNSLSASGRSMFYTISEQRDLLSASIYFTGTPEAFAEDPTIYDMLAEIATTDSRVQTAHGRYVTFRVLPSAQPLDIYGYTLLCHYLDADARTGIDFECPNAPDAKLDQYLVGLEIYKATDANGIERISIAGAGVLYQYWSGNTQNSISLENPWGFRN